MDRRPDSEREQLQFRRQFVLGPYFISRLTFWNKCYVARNLCLQVHPDMDLTQIEQRGIQLTLIGFMIDPDRLTDGNREILKNILSQIKVASDIFKESSRLGGRWILILHHTETTILFNDPGGLRQVFYTNDASQPIWCASQPGIIAEELGLRYSSDRIEFMNSSYFKKDKEYWWPNTTSPYEEIIHLLPNHYLDIFHRISRRFWPCAQKEEICLEEGVKRSSDLLRCLIKAASNRFSLALPITAGLDSRTLLAATKGLTNQIYYYTLIYYSLNEGHPDLQIPTKLLTFLKVKHHSIDCSGEMEDWFRKIYEQNVVMAHDAWGHIAFGLYEHYPNDKVCIKGAVSEIAQCVHHRYGRPKKIDGKTLTYLSGMGQNPFACKHFNVWLCEAKSSVETTGFDILDLFYWEQRIGNWQAMGQMEWDIAQEEFTPFNCRKLLTTLLAVDSAFRKPPKHELYRGIINELWPEVLHEPINPPFGLRARIKHILLSCNFYPMVWGGYNYLKRRLL